MRETLPPAESGRSGGCPGKAYWIVVGLQPVIVPYELVVAGGLIDNTNSTTSAAVSLPTIAFHRSAETAAIFCLRPQVREAPPRSRSSVQPSRYRINGSKGAGKNPQGAVGEYPRTPPECDGRTCKRGLRNRFLIRATIITGCNDRAAPVGSRPCWVISRRSPGRAGRCSRGSELQHVNSAASGSRMSLPCRFASRRRRRSCPRLQSIRIS